MVKKTVKVRIVMLAKLLVGILSACSSGKDSKTDAAAGANSSVAEVQSTRVTPDVEVSSLDGAAILEQRCTVCHSLDRVEMRKQTYEQWENTVDLMMKKGAFVLDTELEILLQFLADNYGS